MKIVKGMLSLAVESRLVFEMLTKDLSSLCTRRGHFDELGATRVGKGTASLREAVRPSDLIVRAGDFDLPRHIG